jgi:enoyl-CoA hydratase/carnithine racemase
MDLAAMSGEGSDPSRALRRFAEVMARLRRAARPTIAVVRGEAQGGGVGLAAACDVVLATEETTFALPEALFGLLPGVILPVIAERIGPHKARLMTLRGRAHDAAWARQAGLVEEIVPAGEMERAVTRAARDLGRVAPARVADLRRWMLDFPRLSGEEALFRGGEITAALVGDPEVRETVRRFVEDGTPPWIGR